jgi:hypothetical protein
MLRRLFFVVCLTTLSVAQSDSVIGKLGRIWKETVVA